MGAELPRDLVWSVSAGLRRGHPLPLVLGSGQNWGVEEGGKVLQDLLREGSQVLRRSGEVEAWRKHCYHGDCTSWDADTSGNLRSCLSVMGHTGY